jgi:hypothetical protein
VVRGGQIEDAASMIVSTSKSGKYLGRSPAGLFRDRDIWTVPKDVTRG